MSSHLKNEFEKRDLPPKIEEKEKIATRSGMALGLLQTKSVEYKKSDYYFSVLDNLRERLGIVDLEEAMGKVG